MTAAVKPPTADSADDQLLADLIEEYATRAQAGEPVDVEAFVQAHPNQADRLRRLLPGVRVLVELEESLGAAAAGGEGPETEARPAGSALGDFRLIREVGRGGMGVVYEAEQLSLGRRVALKVLPFAAMMDARQLQRFHNEARAAAGLHHTNIVPVYGVGCERGVHYYAMQFIDGRTLADFIAGQQGEVVAPVPTVAEAEGAAASATTVPPAVQATSTAPRDAAYFRRVAEWGIQAAEALDCAHALGVVHRDVKPANLLVDAAGRLWVTDFGLAQVQSDAQLTRTGDLVGTLRYMSPEQALGKREPIDHRTDVYSLGATLYELLTLRPVFEGSDRQELLRQIAFEEPRRLRGLNRSIPHELETIVLKALEKNPADRYATAQELADDLRRFLEDRPIKARRPSRLQVARKWARRHRPAVWAGAVVLLLAALLGGGNLLWHFQQRLAADHQAEEALRDSLRWQQEGKLPEALAAIRPASALADSGSINRTLGQRVQERQADLAMLDRLEEIRIQQTNVRDGHFDLAQAERAYWQAFQDYGVNVLTSGSREAAGKLSASSIRAELCTALADWALVCRGKHKKEDSTWKDLLAVARAADQDERLRLWDALERKEPQVLKEFAAEERVLELPPSTLYLLGRALRKSGVVDQSVRLLERAQREHPDDFWINHELAMSLWASKPPRSKEAIPFLTAAVALRPRSPGANLNLGKALLETGAWEEAAAVYDKLILLKPDYAEAHCNRGVVLRYQKKLPNAVAELRKALDLKPDLAQAHCSLGVALADQGRNKEAEEAYHKAIALRGDLVEPWMNLGSLLARQGRLTKAEEAYREAQKRQPDFVPVYAELSGVLYHLRKLKEAEEVSLQGIRLKPDYAEAYGHLGLALKGQGKLAEAEKAYLKAISLKVDYAEPCNNLGNLLVQQGRPNEAEKAFRQAIERQPEYAMAFANLAGVLGRQGKLKDAEEAARTAIRLDSREAQAYAYLGLVLEDQGNHAAALAELKRGLDLVGSGKPGLRSTLTKMVQEAQHRVDLDARLSGLLRGEGPPAGAAECLDLARFCREDKKHYAASARWYAEAFAAQPALADDVSAGHRYNAACAAALAGCGQGKDADKLDAKESARLRRQALDWLRADWEAGRKLLEKKPDKASPVVVQQLRHWLQDPDFARVRALEALAKLPETEREAWQKLWADVVKDLAKAWEGKNALPTVPLPEGKK